MIHKFEFDGDKIVLDVNSGALHKVDEIAWKLLELYPEGPSPKDMEELGRHYDPQEVREARREIDQLIDDELLFSRDNFKEGYSPPKNRILKALCLHLAHDCNLRCVYCFAGQGFYGGDSELMSFEVGKAALDFVIERSEGRKKLDIDFFGGEPLLNFGVLKQLVEYGYERGQKEGKELLFTVTTNAVLLNPDVEKYLRDNRICAVLSLDGVPEVHNKTRIFPNGEGSYDIVAGNISRYIQTAPDDNYYIRGTFTHNNPNFTKDALHMADLGAKNISLEPVVGKPDEKYALREEDLPYVCEEYENLARALLKRALNGEPVNFFHFNIDLNGGPCLPRRLYGCGAGYEYLAVAPNGDIYPCHQFVGQEDLRLGSVLGDFKTNSFVDNLSKCYVYNREECDSCWAKFYCSGGCHANAYNLNNDVFKPYEPACVLMRKRLECALYLKAQLTA